MAMTTCRECQSVVSTEAKACPKCGAEKPGKRPSKFGTYLWAGTVVTLVLVLLVDAAKPPSSSARASQPREDSAELQAAQRAISATRALRSTMRNPDSFSVISARVVGRDVVCFRYRAQNGFGGMNIENAAVWGSTPIAGKAFTAEWSATCGGSGIEVTQYVD